MKYLCPRNPLRRIHLAHLDKVGDHDDGCDSLLPDHAPEGGTCACQWPLSSDKSARPLVAINIAGVDVFAAAASAASAAAHRLQLYQAVVI